MNLQYGLHTSEEKVNTFFILISKWRIHLGLSRAQTLFGF